MFWFESALWRCIARRESWLSLPQATSWIQGTKRRTISPVLSHNSTRRTGVTEPLRFTNSSRRKGHKAVMRVRSSELTRFYIETVSRTFLQVCPRAPIKHVQVTKTITDLPESYGPSPIW